MIAHYAFTYLSCQSCVAKIHCEKCQDEIADILRARPGVTAAEVNIPARTMTVTCDDAADPDDIEDAMDAIGVFLS